MARDQYDLNMATTDSYPRKRKSDKEEDAVSTTSYSYGFQDDKSLWVRLKCGKCCEIRFNPIVSFLAVAAIWGFVAWCVILTDKVPFEKWQSSIVDCFTWLYVGSQDFWAIFIIMLYFSKYSKIKLGKDDEKPEYNDVTWFVMLFACGIGTGLFFYGVAEPIYHYTGKNRYTADPTTPDNTLAQVAMNVTLYHWGIHGWIVYCILGMLLALMSFREGLPLTIKSCFYPLIGDRVFGWMGDLIDLTSIMTTLFGVCTSLGLGVKQLNYGLNLLNSNIPEDDPMTQVIIIWCITAVATASTASGVGMGIRRLSEVCFSVGMFVMIVALFMDDTWYILNLYIQSIGYYFQYIMQIGWHCDAFEQLGPSPAKQLGRGISEVNGKTIIADGGDSWMDNWTMFYWGWWIAWSPFVGMFIAKISRGRTVREFINGTLTAPIIYSFMWLVIFGGAGIKQERQSANLGYCCVKPFDAKPYYFHENLTTEMESQVLNNGLLGDAILNATDAKLWMCADSNNQSIECGDCAMSILENVYQGTVDEPKNITYDQMMSDYKDMGVDFGVVSTDRKYARLSCHKTEKMWFDLMRTYTGIGPFLSVFSLVAIILYFVTSSDSGSLVIDCLSANGDPDPPRIQRIFWALMEGATATALLVAGGTDSLSALQAASIVSGLPYTFIICILCVALWRALQVAAGDLDPHQKGFTIGLFDPLFVRAYQDIRCAEEGTWFMHFLFNIPFGPLTTAMSAARVNGHPGRAWMYAIPSYLLFIGWIGFLIVDLWVPGCWAIAWFFYLAYATFMCSIRVQIRDAKNINGNAIEDFFSCLVFYPLAATQMYLTTKDMTVDQHEDHKGNNIEEGNEAVTMSSLPQQQPPPYMESHGGAVNAGYDLGSTGQRL